MPNSILRTALWVSVPLNLFGVALFVSAASGRHIPLLPIVPPPFYAMQIALTIAIFAGVYAWLAMQDEMNRPLLAVGAIGKLGFFSLFVLHGLAGDFPIVKAAGASPDLVLGLVFAWNLRAPKGAAPRGRFPPGPANRFIKAPLDRPRRSRERRAEDLD